MYKPKIAAANRNTSTATTSRDSIVEKVSPKNDWAHGSDAIKQKGKQYWNTTFDQNLYFADNHGRTSLVQTPPYAEKPAFLYGEEPG